MQGLLKCQLCERDIPDFPFIFGKEHWTITLIVCCWCGIGMMLLKSWNEELKRLGK